MNHFSQGRAAAQRAEQVLLRMANQEAACRHEDWALIKHFLLAEQVVLMPSWISESLRTSEIALS